MSEANKQQLCRLTSRPTGRRRTCQRSMDFNWRTLATLLAGALLVLATCSRADDGLFGQLDGGELGASLEGSATTASSVVEVDGIQFDQDLLEETIDDNLRSRDEQEKSARASAHKDEHPFSKACPYGYFVCDNGECIAPRWRCDGHADCDDYSDELNCTALDIASDGLNLTTIQAQHLPNITSAHLDSLPVQVYGLDFNSSIEPLMIFSTGQSIRGFWMRSRIYFDIITRKRSARSQLDSSAGQPSITEAFSLFFGMLGLDPSRTTLLGPPESSSGPSSSAAAAAAASSRDQEGASKPDNTIVGLDMNPANKEVFWVELGKDPGVYSAVIEDEQFEARHRRQFHGHKKIVEFGLLSPEDIALDTLGRNAYITDAGLPAVVVCSYVHVHCRILLQTKIHKPRAIIADSTSGWVIFTDWGDRPGIFLVSMDGSRRETLIETDVVWPNGLAHDQATNSLFWADARLNKIERVDLRTRKRTELVKEVGTNPFSVSVFESRVYWSDWSGNEIKTCNKDTGNGTRNVMRAEDIYGIHIYHPDLHKQAEQQANPCWSKHCSHLCLLTPGPSSALGLKRQSPIGATCACPDSMTLSVLDHATCYESHLAFLLVNANNYIAQLFPERIGLRVVEEIVHSRDHAIQDIASDWLHYKLFFFDASRRQILSADFSGRQTTIQKFAAIGTRSIRGLVYDLQSDNLFWLDPELGTLSLCSVRGLKFQKVLRHNLAGATSMVLDAKNRLFYIALGGSAPRIIRTDIMGHESSEVLMLDKRDIGLPIALHLDEQMQRLYWADSKYGHIESVDLDVKARTGGWKRGTRNKWRGRLSQLQSFSVYHDYLMWMTADSDYIFKARRDERTSKPVPFRLPASVSRHAPSSDYKRLITLNPMTETLSSPCFKRACSHACMLERDREARCICPDGFKLQASNQSNCVEASAPEPNLVDRVATPLRPRPLASKPLAAHIMDELLQQHRHTSANEQPAPAAVQRPKEVLIVENLSGGAPPAPVSHAKSAPSPHLALDQTLEQLGANVEQQLSGAEPQQPRSANKFVWLITFLLVLTGGALITAVVLTVLNKQGRLPRQVRQLTVSFVSPLSGSASATASGDKDKTMLLLDTDS